MNASYWIDHFRLIACETGVLFAIGLYCVMVTPNLIRVLIGLELVTKSVTLLLGLAGAVTGHMGTAEAFIITLIVLEVVAIAVAAGLVIGIFKQHGEANVSVLTDLKG
ncbi:MAG TPA: NADH-quinone oxidoreductase subunit K [Anaeromyxobacteraceae bacterium]|nr:NADH-quinone oxidoreductase subunit K [Anaeromyxobacteraceae bacterium]